MRLTLSDVTARPVWDRPVLQRPLRGRRDRPAAPTSPRDRSGSNRCSDVTARQVEMNDQPIPHLCYLGDGGMVEALNVEVMLFRVSKILSNPFLCNSGGTFAKATS